MDWKPTVIRHNGLMVEDAMCEPEDRVCLTCGEIVSKWDKYCHECGVRLLTPEQAENEDPLLYMEYQRWEGDR